MNKSTHNSLSNKTNSSEVSHRDAVTSTESRTIPDDESTTANSTSRGYQEPHTSRLPMRNYFKEFKSCVLSSEDVAGFHYTTTKDFDYLDREPMFVIVDSSCVSNPSSRELLIDSKYNSRDTVLKKHYNKNVIHVDVPSTSRDIRNEILPAQLKDSESIDEMQMMDINLQSENELSICDSDLDNDSIVISYLRNKDAFLEMEELSETSLDVEIPSFPGSPRSITNRPVGSIESLFSLSSENLTYKQAIQLLHNDNEFLIAAETGDEKMIQILIDQGVDVHEKDHLGRNALHLAVCTGNRHAVAMLLNAGVEPTVKDNLGMTPLSLCLMRRPSWRMANMLFNHGAKILPRSTPMDTGLFLQFVMMCIPTREEERILRLLVEKGALVNDPECPGGRQALHFAAMSNNTTLITILVELGANLFETNHRHETPKEVAATFKCKEAYALLQEFEELCTEENTPGVTTQSSSDPPTDSTD